MPRLAALSQAGASPLPPAHHPLCAHKPHPPNPKNHPTAKKSKNPQIPSTKPHFSPPHPTPHRHALRAKTAPAAQRVEPRALFEPNTRDPRGPHPAATPWHHPRHRRPARAGDSPRPVAAHTPRPHRSPTHAPAQRLGAKQIPTTPPKATPAHSASPRGKPASSPPCPSVLSVVELPTSSLLPATTPRPRTTGSSYPPTGTSPSASPCRCRTSA